MGYLPAPTERAEKIPFVTGALRELVGEDKMLDRGGVGVGARKRNGIAGTPVRGSINGPWVQEGGKEGPVPALRTL